MFQNFKFLLTISFTLTFILALFPSSSRGKKKEEIPRKYYPDDKNISEHNEKAYITKMTPYKFTYKPPPITDIGAPPINKWTIAADDDCMPEITCPMFNVASPTFNGKCEDQVFEVSDGITGMKQFCGRVGPKNIVVSNHIGLRDLYITFRNHYKSYTARFECDVSCGAKESAIFLPKVLKPKVNPECFCGQKPVKSRIIGGHETYHSEFPWIAAMVVAQTRQPYCIGSVINDRMILTAGHCFKGKFRKHWNTQIILNGFLMDPMPNINVIKTTVIYRTYDNETLEQLDRGNNSFRFDIDRIWIHPLYESNSSDFDTALMILSKPIDPKKFRAYSPICLPELTYDIDHYSGKTAVISGWGLPSTTAPGTNTLMKQITVEIFKPAFCRDMFGDRLVSVKRQLCAAYHDASEDSCAGDSGGPLVIQYRPQVWYQIGIISWGDGCALVDHPGVYYRTTSTNQWIRHMSNVRDAVWCDVPD